MSHHGSNPMDHELQRLLAKQIQQAAQMGEEARRLDLGGTGEFPQGQLTKEDEGEIQIAITHMHGEVILNFGKPIAWIGFSPEQAEQIAYSLIEKASQAKKQRG